MTVDRRLLRKSRAVVDWGIQHRETGRGMGSSGLQFDQIEPV